VRNDFVVVPISLRFVTHVSIRKSAKACTTKQNGDKISARLKDYGRKGRAGRDTVGAATRLLTFFRLEATPPTPSPKSHCYFFSNFGKLRL
jgi:hypothetical protein